jgi:hypothetical protein
MTADPAYLRNLKKYARVPFGSEGVPGESLQDLKNESDRGAIILAATSVEDFLEFALGSRMKVLEKDTAARSEVFAIVTAPHWDFMWRRVSVKQPWSGLPR